MTRDQRLEQVREVIRAQTTDSVIRELAEAAYLRGYDEGFADGAVRGSTNTAAVFEKAFDALTAPVGDSR
jgi:hypothetical protein